MTVTRFRSCYITSKSGLVAAFSSQSHGHVIELCSLRSVTQYAYSFICIPISDFSALVGAVCMLRLSVCCFSAGTVLSVKVLDVGRGSSVAPIRELCTLLSPVRTVQYVVFVTFPPCKTTVRCSIGSVPILNPKSWAPSSWCNFSHDLLPESFAFSA